MASTSATLLSDLKSSLSGVIRGKEDAIDLLLIGVLARGHLLLEDVPGVGKTTLAKALARLLDVKFTRVQFTPDLLPADILGSQILRPKEGTFEFRPGPVFTNVLLADEINRASPRTQAALLEAMNEAQVTIEGETRPLSPPFMVIATQNPVDFRGTYPLPEAQLDRFLLRFALGHPSSETELEILYDRQTANPLDDLKPIANVEELVALQRTVRDVTVERNVARYLLRLAELSRQHSRLELGISTRGSLACFRAMQARAFLHGRDYAIPDDLHAVASPVLAHRLTLAAESRYHGHTPDSVLAELIERTEIPV